LVGLSLSTLLRQLKCFLYLPNSFLIRSDLSLAREATRKEVANAIRISKPDTNNICITPYIATIIVETTNNSYFPSSFTDRK
jgi:hypothetical protein